MQCGGAMKKMQKGGRPGAFTTTSSKIGIGITGAGLIGTASKMISDAIKQRKENKRLAAAKQKANATAKLDKKQKGGMPTKVLGPAKKPFAAGIPFFTGAGQTGPEYMKKGGSFAPNRAVQASCKGGMVRDENGRCVMARKMATGGFPDLTGDKKVTRADILKGRGVFKDGGSVKPSAGLTAKKKSSVAKKASAGKDIGKKGKMFDKIAAKAGGGEKGKRIAAAAMWKNIKRG